METFRVDRCVQSRYSGALLMDYCFARPRTSAMPGRKRFVLYGTAAVLFVCGVSALVSAVLHQPNFYRQTQIAPGAGRRTIALKFVSEIDQMIKAKDAKRETWGCKISESG